MTERVFLQGRLLMHARLQGGALYVHEILDGDKVVGSVSARLDKKKGTQTRRFSLGDQTFDDLAAFRKAYELKLRDDEFDAAAPKATENPPA